MIENMFSLADGLHPVRSTTHAAPHRPPLASQRLAAQPRRHAGLAAILLAPFLAMLGCGQAEGPEANHQAPDAPPAWSREPVDQSVGGLDQPGGVIRGRVAFVGPKLDPPPLEMIGDNYCADAQRGKQPTSERWLFGQDDTLQNVLVYLSGGPDWVQQPADRFAPPSEPAVLDQTCCRFRPRVLPFMVQQPVMLRNSDRTLHNVQAQPKRNQPFNEGLPGEGTEVTRRFRTPELGIRVSCDVHPWMTAWLHALPHPFYAVTGPEGTFEIRGIPPGQYELSTWHEFDRFQPERKAIPIDLTAEQPVSLTITYRPGGRG